MNRKFGVGMLAQHTVPPTRPTAKETYYYPSRQRHAKYTQNQLRPTIPVPQQNKQQPTGLLLTQTGGSVVEVLGVLMAP